MAERGPPDSTLKSNSLNEENPATTSQENYSQMIADTSAPTSKSEQSCPSSNAAKQSASTTVTLPCASQYDDERNMPSASSRRSYSLSHLDIPNLVRNAPPPLKPLNHKFPPRQSTRSLSMFHKNSGQNQKQGQLNSHRRAGDRDQRSRSESVDNGNGGFRYQRERPKNQAGRKNAAPPPSSNLKANTSSKNRTPSVTFHNHPVWERNGISKTKHSGNVSALTQYGPMPWNDGHYIRHINDDTSNPHTMDARGLRDHDGNRENYRRGRDRSYGLSLDDGNIPPPIHNPDLDCTGYGHPLIHKPKENRAERHHNYHLYSTMSNSSNHSNDFQNIPGMSHDYSKRDLVSESSNEHWLSRKLSGKGDMNHCNLPRIPLGSQDHLGLNRRQRADNLGNSFTNGSQSTGHKKNLKDKINNTIEGRNFETQCSNGVACVEKQINHIPSDDDMLRVVNGVMEYINLLTMDGDRKHERKPDLRDDRVNGNSIGSKRLSKEARTREYIKLQPDYYFQNCDNRMNSWHHPSSLRDIDRRRYKEKSKDSSKQCQFPFVPDRFDPESLRSKIQIMHLAKVPPSKESLSTQSSVSDSRYRPRFKEALYCETDSSSLPEERSEEFSSSQYTAAPPVKTKSLRKLSQLHSYIHNKKLIKRPEFSEPEVGGSQDTAHRAPTNSKKGNESKTYQEMNGESSQRNNSAFESEIEEEMRRARNMDIPFKDKVIEESNLNPQAMSFSPTCHDANGNRFSMVTKKGISFFHPQVDITPPSTHYVIPNECGYLEELPPQNSATDHFAEYNADQFNSMGFAMQNQSPNDMSVMAQDPAIQSVMTVNGNVLTQNVGTALPSQEYMPALPYDFNPTIVHAPAPFLNGQIAFPNLASNQFNTNTPPLMQTMSPVIDQQYFVVDSSYQQPTNQDFFNGMVHNNQLGNVQNVDSISNANLNHHVQGNGLLSNFQHSQSVVSQHHPNNYINQSPQVYAPTQTPQFAQPSDGADFQTAIDQLISTTTNQPSPQLTQFEATINAQITPTPDNQIGVLPPGHNFVRNDNEVPRPQRSQYYSSDAPIMNLQPYMASLEYRDPAESSCSVLTCQFPFTAPTSGDKPWHNISPEKNLPEGKALPVDNLPEKVLPNNVSISIREKIPSAKLRLRVTGDESNFMKTVMEKLVKQTKERLSNPSVTESDIIEELCNFGPYIIDNVKKCWTHQGIGEEANTNGGIDNKQMNKQIINNNNRTLEAQSELEINSDGGSINSSQGEGEATPPIAIENDCVFRSTSPITFEYIPYLHEQTRSNPQTEASTPNVPLNKETGSESGESGVDISPFEFRTEIAFPEVAGQETARQSESQSDHQDLDQRRTSFGNVSVPARIGYFEKSRKSPPTH